LTNPSAVPQLVNPITLVTPDFPPTISIHGEKDSICSVEASRLFTQELKKLGVETTLVIIPGAEHGLYPEVDFMQYFEEAAEFLERYA
jgi:dipeptidyl aminopeptidase/acylaminoacyl peptidase